MNDYKKNIYFRGFIYLVDYFLTFRLFTIITIPILRIHQTEVFMCFETIAATNVKSSFVLNNINIFPWSQYVLLDNLNVSSCIWGNQVFSRLLYPYVLYNWEFTHLWMPLYGISLLIFRQRLICVSLAFIQHWFIFIWKTFTDIKNAINYNIICFPNI